MPGGCALDGGGLSFEVRNDLMNNLEIKLFEGYKRLINLTLVVVFNEHRLRSCFDH